MSVMDALERESVSVLRSSQAEGLLRRSTLVRFLGSDCVEQVVERLRARSPEDLDSLVADLGGEVLRERSRVDEGEDPGQKRGPQTFQALLLLLFLPRLKEIAWFTRGVRHLERADAESETLLGFLEAVDRDSLQEGVCDRLLGAAKKKLRQASRRRLFCEIGSRSSMAGSTAFPLINARTITRSSFEISSRDRESSQAVLHSSSSLALRDVTSMRLQSLSA